MSARAMPSRREATVGPAPRPRAMAAVDPFAKRGRVDVVIETPKGSRNKFKYDLKQDVIRLGKQLPAGAVFPFDFGFIPQTLAEDGDPVDVLVMLDQPAFPGCLVRTRLIGVIDAEQTSRKGRTARNPRLVAVATKSTEQRDIRDLSELPSVVLDEIEHFFASYNTASGRSFRVLGRRDRKAAAQSVAAGVSAYRRAGRRGALGGRIHPRGLTAVGRRGQDAQRQERSA